MVGVSDAFKSIDSLPGSKSFSVSIFQWLWTFVLCSVVFPIQVMCVSS